MAVTTCIADEKFEYCELSQACDACDVQVEDEQAFLRATVQKLMGLKDDQKEELETSLARVYVYTDYIPDAQ
jgi:hypothetical protein